MSGMVNMEDLSLFYGGKKIRENIDFSLEAGTLCCLVGKNGVGKSTLTRTMAGLHKHYSGSVRLKSRDISLYKPLELAKTLSVVLTESIGEINYLTVRETVEMGRYPYCNQFATLSPEDRLMVEKAMEAVDISCFADRHLNSLSDGQRQRVLIAKALAQDCPLICLDEALSFLDLPTKIEITELLQKLAHRQNKAIVLSTHEIDIALEFADKLWVFCANGNNKEFLRPDFKRGDIMEDVFSSGSSEFFLRFIHRGQSAV